MTRVKIYHQILTYSYHPQTQPGSSMCADCIWRLWKQTADWSPELWRWCSWWVVWPPGGPYPVGKETIRLFIYLFIWVNIGSGNGMAPNRCQAITWTNADTLIMGSLGFRFKNARELLNLRALKISMVYKNHIFQCMGKILCVEFQRVPLKFHTKYLTHTLREVDFIQRWKFKSS